MLFNSFDFIFVFLPLVFILYFGLNHFGHHKLAKCSLVAGSLFFYAYFNLSYLPIIVSSILVNYAVSRLLARDYGRGMRLAIFWTGIAFNVGLLGYFKYYDFFVDNINTVFGSSFMLRHILLPLGISFFTFQQLAFVVDSYRRDVKIPTFLDYCNFVTFFPQLIAGPIVLPEEMLPQFEDPQNRHVRFRNLCDGLFIFTVGLAKKVLIADSIAVFVNAGFDSGLSNFTLAEAWLISLSYTFQLYFDFSGYCDMAIGIGRMFNINLPLNFNGPYLARGFQEFWKRWHMTLNRFLTRYLYFPLGGSRKGDKRTYLNIMTVFLVSGLWHGAGWTFVTWGALHGIGVSINRAWRKWGKISFNALTATIITFVLVNILWVIFRAKSLEQGFGIISNMFDNTKLYITEDYKFRLWSILSNRTNLIILLLAVVFAFFGPTTYKLMQVYGWHKTKTAVVIVLFVICIFFISRISTFLYFNF